MINDNTTPPGTIMNSSRSIDERRRTSAITSQLERLRNSQDTDTRGTEDATPAVVGEQYLAFLLHGQEMVVKAEFIQAIELPMHITPVPNIVSWIRGVANLRGSIASVVDFRAFLGLEEVPVGVRTRILSLQSNDMVICLLVDGVNEMLSIPQSAVKDGGVYSTFIPSWIASYVTSYVQLGERTLVLLDVTRLLFSDKMQLY